MLGERKKGMKSRLVAILVLAFSLLVLWFLYRKLTPPFVRARDLRLREINSIALDLIAETRSRFYSSTISVEVHYDPSLLDFSSLGPYNDIEVSDIDNDSGVVKVKFRNTQGGIKDKAEIARLTFKIRNGQKEVPTHIEISSKFK